MNIYDGQHLSEILDKLTGNLSKGFYIDIGANHPVDSNVTKMFYDRGWTGINVEPVQEQFNLLSSARPKDINLMVACGDNDGELELYHQNFSTNGLTTAKKKYAEMGKVAGVKWNVPSFTTTVTFKIQMITLKTICDIYVKDHNIDFLKIDVEGFEKEVILGMDWENYKPKILCIESTEPHTLRETYQEWENILLDAGYMFIEKDLYNRYYKIKE